MAVDLYQTALRPLLFNILQADPEQVQQNSIELLAGWQQGTLPGATMAQAVMGQWFGQEDPRLHQNLWGLNFPNPIGLAAGFDKDGRAASMWHYLGFGCAEVGTVTYHPQPGNPRPRLFRLPADRAALNRMGFNNQGSAAMAACLAQRPPSPIPLGINLGKSKITPITEAAADYVGSFQRLEAYGDYFTINVSSPNTPGLRDLQAVSALAEILAALAEVNSAPKPLLVKIAPDLDPDDIKQVVDLALAHNLAGIIATNTTIQRRGLRTPGYQEAPGGISGAPLRDRSTAVIRLIYQHSQGQLPIVGVGGIFSAADAWEKIIAGASLIQLYTGWIYEGPWLVSRILSGLTQRLERSGFASITEAIGWEHRA